MQANIEMPNRERACPVRRNLAVLELRYHDEQATTMVIVVINQCFSSEEMAEFPMHKRGKRERDERGERGV